MNRMLTGSMSLLIITMCMLFTSCANIKDIEPEEAMVDLVFKPAEGEQSTFTTANGLTWNIEKAYLLVGEIGIHWDRKNSERSFSPVAPRHDVSGKISPKVYGYYALNLLDTLMIQRLTVPPLHYDHIHMISVPANAITTNDSVAGLSKAIELQNNSLYISGTVSDGTETRPFEFKNDKEYGENDLGDILTDISIYEGDHYTISMHPNLNKWFQQIKWAHFAMADTLIVSPTENSLVFSYIEGTFKADNAMTYSMKKN